MCLYLFCVYIYLSVSILYISSILSCILCLVLSILCLFYVCFSLFSDYPMSISIHSVSVCVYFYKLRCLFRVRSYLFSDNSVSITKHFVYILCLFLSIPRLLSIQCSSPVYSRGLAHTNIDLGIACGGSLPRCQVTLFPLSPRSGLLTPPAH